MKANIANILIFLVGLAGVTFSLNAQVVEGTVVSSSGGHPISDVAVSLGFTQYRTRTDTQGKFSLNVDNSDILKINFFKKSVRVTWNKRLGYFYLQGASTITGLSIHSLNGKMIFNKNISTSDGMIKTPSLGNAIYILRFKNYNGANLSVKLNANSASAFFDFSSQGEYQKKVAAQVPLDLLFRHDDYYPSEYSVTELSLKRTFEMEPDPRNFVFDINRLNRYDFTIAVEDSTKMEREARMENYIPATFSFNKSLIGQVGFRYKGSSFSIPYCFSEQGERADKPFCEKVSFKVKFHEYDPSKRFYLMKTLNLHSLSSDETKMHDMLGYELFRDMGIYAPRTAYAQIFINNVFQGLFLAVESIDGRFTKSRWPEFGDGNLYKEVWPKSHSTSYYLNGLETNNDPEDNPDVTGMINIYDAIEKSTENTFTQNLSPFIDFNYMVRYMAVDRVIKNWDGVASWYGTTAGGASNHNFFFYQEEATVGGKTWLIPWDLDNSFWRKDNMVEVYGLPQWNENVACTDYYVNGGYLIPACCDKFTRLFATTHWNQFVETGEELLQKLFITDTLHDKIDRYTSLLDTVIEKDPVLNVESWKFHVDSLKENIVVNRLHFDQYIHGLSD